MTKGNGSPAARRQLGAVLRKLREESGKTIADVEEARIAGATKVWRIETGKSLPAINDVLGFCWLYNADQATTDRLTDMVVALGDGSGGWWEAHGAAVPSWLHLYVGMEQSASEIKIFEPDLIQGLLQTRDYAVAANDDPRQAEHNADMRMTRQKAVFARTDPVRLSIVLGAAALRREIGGADVLKSQLKHLRSLDQPNLEVRVLSDDVGMHPAILGTFTLFDFAEKELDAVVYVPLLVGGRYMEEARHTERYRAAFTCIWPLSTPLEAYTP